MALLAFPRMQRWRASWKAWWASQRAMRPLDPRALSFMIVRAFIVVFASVLFGMLAVTGSPVLIGLGVGIVGGAALLSAPRTSVVLVLSLGLGMGALISMSGAAFNKLPWAVSVACMLLALPAFMTFTNVKRNPAPRFIMLAVVFLLYAVTATVLHGKSFYFAETLAGFKRYFQAYGLMLALALLPFTLLDFKRWEKVLLGLAVLQFPFALYELLVLVPRRGGLSGSSASTDVVAGTFGANLEGGSPAISMVVFLLIVCCFLFSRWRNGAITGTKILLLCLFLLLPVMMGENKVVLLMFPMIWLVLVRHDVARSPMKYFPVLVSGAVMTCLIGYIYVEFIMHSTLSDVVKSTIDYNFAQGGYASYYLNRTTVLNFWLSKQGLDDPVSFFFGNGLGSSFVGQISGHVGIRYPRYGINLTGASTLLWDLGIIGLALFVAIFVSAWRTAGKIYRESGDLRVKADCLAIQATISLFMMLTVYSQDVVNLIPMEILYSMVLGYLGYLYSAHAATRKSPAAAA